MKAGLIFPEGEFFQKALAGAREALAGNEIVQVWPGLIGEVRGEEALKDCEVVVADVTGRNPQVMYYTGWADALRKRVILVSCYAEDFPFSLERKPIIYARDAEYLKEELRKRLGSGGEEEDVVGVRNGVQNGARKGVDGRERFYEIFGDLMKKHGQEHHGRVEMEDEKTFALIEQDLDLALVQEMARRAREMGLRIKLL